jgi:lipopolysaccharide/colanic/teichoic acid biosynthesis glycosyltransferase
VSLLPITNAPQFADRMAESVSAGASKIMNEEAFKRMMAIERKRTERTNEPFLLMLLESALHHGSKERSDALERLVSILPSCIRDTDIVGWYKDQSAIGVMYTGLTADNKNSVLGAIVKKVSTTLKEELTSDQFDQVSISFHFFPDDWEYESSGRPNNPALYPDLLSVDKSRRSVLVIKRAIDIVCTSLILIPFAPVFAMIALAIKASSKGPVLFKQQRVGRYGKPFTFLKFRSMYINNDDRVHREYVTKLIANEAEQQKSNGNNHDAYKLMDDKRVTAVGKLLRRSSMDELPQLLNVLMGDMSLVGPRPPLPYEVAVYQTWHRRRVLEVKPGITGLWQVTGRSRVKFDEMVRLDLRYATSWSPWLDFKILMLTPLAVIKCEGAY